MQPTIELNIVAILLAVAGAFSFNMIYYSVLFGKTWRKELGLPEDEKPSKKQMFSSLALNILGLFLMVWVFDHNIQAWDARSWGHTEPFMPDAAAAAIGATLTWFGFFMPQDMNKVIFHGRSWKLFFIDTFSNLCSLLIAAYILVFV